MLPPEDRKGEAQQTQSLRKPKGETGAQTFPDFALPWKALPFLRHLFGLTLLSLLRDREAQGLLARGAGKQHL